MYKQVAAISADISQPITGARFVRGAWSPDAISERDRRDFEESLKVQAERLKRKGDVRRE
jgi:hypothetical protein